MPQLSEFFPRQGNLLVRPLKADFDFEAALCAPADVAGNTDVVLERTAAHAVPDPESPSRTSTHMAAAACPPPLSKACLKLNAAG